MPGFGNLGAGGGWSPLSGYGRQRSLAPMGSQSSGSGNQQAGGWGSIGSDNAGPAGSRSGWGQPDQSQPSPRSRQPLAGANPSPAGRSGMGGGGGDPVQAYRAAQNMPVSGGYSTVGFDPTPPPPRLSPPAGQAAVGQPGGATPRSAGGGGGSLDSAQPMPKPSPDQDKQSTPVQVNNDYRTGGGDPLPESGQRPLPAPPPAPTSAQVSANPSAYAGTSFDPSRIVDPMAGFGGGPQPVNTLQPLGNPYGIGDTPPDWVLDAQRQSGSMDWGGPAGLYRQQQLQGGGAVGPMLSDQAAAQQMGFERTNDPTIWQTGTGATYNAAGPRDQSEPYDVWRRRVYGDFPAAYQNWGAQRTGG